MVDGNDGAQVAEIEADAPAAKSEVAEQTVFYVGDVDQIKHHVEPLTSQLNIEIAPPQVVFETAKPGDVCIFFNEFFDEFRDLCRSVKARGCATLYAVDGILEWRSAWEGGSQPEVMRPVLCHKFAAIGNSQKRVLEAWGNDGVCEVVGVPRFDKFADLVPRNRKPNEPIRIMVMTAKWPAFSPSQHENVLRSLQHCKDWFNANATLSGVKVEPIWRLTGDLPELLGIQNHLTNTNGNEFHELLATVDALITTPSTAMLEGMLHGIPVALLDYNNCPHLVPASWRITAHAHVQKTMLELMTPPQVKMAHQHELLHDALACEGSASDRMVELIRGMLEIATSRDPIKIAQAFKATAILNRTADSPIVTNKSAAAASYLRAVETKRLQLTVEQMQTELGETQSELNKNEEQNRLAIATISQLEGEVSRLNRLPSQRFKRRMQKILGRRLFKALKIA